MLLGFDIGGTKCAVITALREGEGIRLLSRAQCPTDLSVAPEEMIDRLVTMADALVGDGEVEAVGISCGGPLDSRAGVIAGPPNLPGWTHVEIVSRLSGHYKVPVRLQNDANACALAEWKFGAGRGVDDLIFLTFGTGLGAGLILDGRLYTGVNDNAGEVGHIRLESDGPVGYGKAGSFEGFCSGGGLARLGLQMAVRQAEKGEPPLYFRSGAPEEVTAKSIAQAAEQGDATARLVYRTCGEQLGKGLSILMDILNPRRIIIGSIFARSHHLLWEAAKAVIEREALPQAVACCDVVPAGLGERIGDYAAIATALL